MEPSEMLIWTAAYVAMMPVVLLVVAVGASAGWWEIDWSYHPYIMLVSHAVILWPVALLAVVGGFSALAIVRLGQAIGRHLRTRRPEGLQVLDQILANLPERQKKSQRVDRR